MNILVFFIVFGTSGVVVVHPVELNDKKMINKTSPSSQFSKFFICLVKLLLNFLR